MCFLSCTARITLRPVLNERTLHPSESPVVIVIVNRFGEVPDTVECYPV